MSSLRLLIPRKALGEAKSRLAAHLGDEPRRRLVEALLAGVLDAARRCPAVAEIWVLSPTRPPLPGGVRWLPDRGRDLNDALARALGRLVPDSPLPLAVVAGDLPLLAPADLAALAAGVAAGAVVLAPDRRGEGTNALALPAGVSMRPCFGPGSLWLHRAEAARQGRGVRLLRRPGLAFDLDRVQDLAELIALHPHPWRTALGPEWTARP
ncbi:MAG: 2-phospho-L-lactate guanylyltransferase [Porticoccaceae bacterium]|nr:MAG: 2-phospho-L-lactate guanylyltransferase [Porticoccaceae bacterium]